MNTSPSSSNTSPSSSNTSPSSLNTSPPSSNASPPFSNTSPPSSNTARYLTAILEYPGAVFEYLAVVLEYLSTGISELPGNAPRNIKKHPVVPRLAIRNDDEVGNGGLFIASDFLVMDVSLLYDSYSSLFSHLYPLCTFILILMSAKYFVAVLELLTTTKLLSSLYVCTRN
ncbi:hypothetical protein B0H13DRAFT_2077047 [Mycena leptocephala]|nr:hypothetical protein B0H13DRAFT_2077047 [Mycena leptocephala]